MKTRDAGWDNMKFALIYCVVLGHVFNMVTPASQFFTALHLFIYIFHMPAFLFLAGLFSKRAVRERRYDRAFSFLFLYVFIRILQFLVSSFINGKPARLDMTSISGVAWFALVLFFYYLITMGMNRWNWKLVLVFAVALGIMAGYMRNLSDYLAGMRAFSFYVFFYLGYICPIDRLRELSKKLWLKVVSAFALVVMFIVCYVGRDSAYQWLNFLKCNNTYKKLGLVPWGGIYRGIHYALALALIFCIIMVIPVGKSIISAWGSRTIQVFAMHYPVLQILTKAVHIQDRLAAVCPNHYQILLVIIALLVTIVLSLKFFEPFFKWITTPIPRTVQKE